MSTKKDLEYVKKEQEELSILSRIAAILEWDDSVNLPPEGSKDRSEQLSLIKSQIHKRELSNKLFSKTKKLLKKSVSKDDRIILKKLYKTIKKARKLPTKFVEELTKEESISRNAWEAARKENDFKIFEPHLEKIVKLKRREAKYISLPGHPYNSLLDEFEEGMTVEKLKIEFDKLKLGLLEIIKKINSSKKKFKQINFKNFDKEQQMPLVYDVVERMGLKKSFSRLDFSTHPFTDRMGDKDIRITTAIRKEDPSFAFSSSIHEAGHGLYEANLPKEYSKTFVYDSPSYGLHESQSRIWENNIGLSRPFWKFYYKKFNEILKEKKSPEEWYEFSNKLKETPIRISSDEVHYALHIILRFEIELGLIEGKIKVHDLPKVWNKRTKEYFGITPKNDVEGVMQDVHWPSGLFGYFPTYAIGTIYAAQLQKKMKEEIKDFDKFLEKGDFSKVSNWLKEKVHKKGATKSAEEIIGEVTGEGLNSKVFLDYLDKKYSKIYGYKI